MRISIDYDGTYTANPYAWERGLGTFMDFAEGWELVCVTMRYPNEPIEINWMGKKIPVYYTSRKAKKPFMESIGKPVDIWIDDSPHWLLQDSA